MSGQTGFGNQHTCGPTAIHVWTYRFGNQHVCGPTAIHVWTYRFWQSTCLWANSDTCLDIQVLAINMFVVQQRYMSGHTGLAINMFVVQQRYMSGHTGFGNQHVCGPTALHVWIQVLAINMFVVQQRYMSGHTGFGNQHVCGPTAIHVWTYRFWQSTCLWSNSDTCLDIQVLAINMFVVQQRYMSGHTGFGNQHVCGPTAIHVWTYRFWQSTCLWSNSDTCLDIQVLAINMRVTSEIYR